MSGCSSSTWRTAPDLLTCVPAKRAIIPGRFRAAALPGSAYASPTRSPTASAVFSGMLARGPAGFDSRRVISSCDTSGLSLTAYGGGSPRLWPTASSAIASGSCFLVGMVISLAPSGEDTHRGTTSSEGPNSRPAVTIDEYGPPRASEVEAHKGRGQPTYRKDRGS
jgi:hypothetical protein